MAQSFTSSLPDSGATRRQLQLLVVILALSNIGLGLFSFYLLRKVDRGYKELIVRSVPVLNDLQTLTAKAIQAIRSTNPLLFEGSAEKRTEAQRLSLAAIDADRTLRTNLLAAGQLTAQPSDSREFQQSGESFTRLVTDVCQLLAAGQMAEAVRLREEGLRLAFERYLDATTKVADLLEDESLRASEDFSARTGSASRLVLGFASWPLLAAAGLVLVGALFILVFLVLFRGRDLSDGP